MADDTHGMGIPLPADSTPIHRFPEVARLMGEKIAAILAGDLLPEGISKVAAAEVRAILASADILTGTDPRVPTLSETPDHLFVLRDSNDKETWLGARRDNGGPTPWAVQLLREALGVGPMDAPGYLFAVTDANRRLTDLAIREEDGQFADFVIERLKKRILEGAQLGGGASITYADAPYAPGSDVFPLKADPLRVAAFGSSSTDWGSGQLSAPFTAKGATWFGEGRAGEWAEHTAARLGSIPALVTITDGSIPPSGPAPATVSNLRPSSSLKPYTGTLAGVPGTLASDGNRFTFTRTTSGSAKPVPAKTPMIPDLGNRYRDATMLLWMGKNNLTNTASTVDEVVRITDVSFDWLAPLAKRCLVLGHFVNTGAAASDPSRAKIRAVNAAHRARYGRVYIDVPGYLTGSQVWKDTGITPTAADLTEQQLGNKPPSLSADDGHLNAAGYTAIAQNLIDPRLTELGWY